MKLVSVISNYQSYKSAGLPIPAVDKTLIIARLAKLRGEGRLTEFLVLSTCCRIEIYFCSKSSDAVAHIMTELAHYLPNHPFSPLTKNEGMAAVNHLFEVSAGLHSSILGECEILGQIRDAYLNCSSAGYTKTHLNKLFQSAISVGKIVRSNTNIAMGASSIESIALQKLLSCFNNKKEASILIVGIGKLGSKLLRLLSRNHFTNLTIANRSIKLLGISPEQPVKIIPFNDLKNYVKNFDAIFLCTETPDAILEMKDLSDQKYQLLIDFGARPNISVSENPLKNIELINLAAVDAAANKNIQKRLDAVPKARKLIGDSKDKFEGWLQKKALLEQYTIKV